jgi:hypothetical protein
MSNWRKNGQLGLSNSQAENLVLANQRVIHRSRPGEGRARDGAADCTKVVASQQTV